MGNMHRRIKGSGRKNGLTHNPQNKEVPATGKYVGHKATKRPVHANGKARP